MPWCCLYAEIWGKGPDTRIEYGFTNEDHWGLLDRFQLNGGDVRWPRTLEVLKEFPFIGREVGDMGERLFIAPMGRGKYLHIGYEYDFAEDLVTLRSMFFSTRRAPRLH